MGFNARWEMASKFKFGRVSGLLAHPHTGLSHHQRLLSIFAKVCALMNVESGEWKANLIQDIFLEHEVDSILSIP